MVTDWSDMRLRAFETSDAPPVTSLIHRTIDACYSGVYPPRAVDFFKDYHSFDRVRDRDATGYVLVVEHRGAIIATGSLVGNEITGVFVDPASQGLGIGAHVMDELEEVARAAGLTSTALSVSLPSRGFYERRGYRVLESRSIDVGGGEHLDYWAAEKRLQDASRGSAAAQRERSGPVTAADDVSSP